jgi:hypothetical protein
MALGALQNLWHPLRSGPAVTACWCSHTILMRIIFSLLSMEPSPNDLTFYSSFSI